MALILHYLTNSVAFAADYVKIVEDRLLLSVTKMLPKNLLAVYH